MTESNGFIDEGGLQVFQIAIVQWISKEGEQWTSADILTPGGSREDDPQLIEVLGAIEVAKDLIKDFYEDDS